MAVSYRTLLLAVALVLLPFQASASTISYTSTASDTSPASGNSVSFSGLLAMNQFDPTLGTLTSMDFSLTARGFLYQDVTFTGWQADYFMYGTLSFLDQTKIVATDEIYSACGALQTCQHFQTNVSYSPGLIPLNAMKGTITDDLDTFKDWQYGYTTFASGPGTLGLFIGTSQMLLPVASDLRVNWGFGATGSLLPVQQINWDSRVNYNYIPTAAHAPEPRWSVVALLLALGVGKFLKARSNT